MAAESDEPMIGTETPAARTARIVVMTSSMRRNLRAEGVRRRPTRPRHRRDGGLSDAAADAATVFARGFESFQDFFVALYSEPKRFCARIALNA